MKDSECVAFLQDMTPKMHMRWEGFRRVRTQVCKRLDKRIKTLELKDINSYRVYLQQNDQEWIELRQLFRVTISRFYRDKLVFSRLEQVYLPMLAKQAIEHEKKTLKTWSIGCASGEEPYTLSIIWKHILSRQFPGLKMSILATDVDAGLLERAAKGIYTYTSIKNLPADWQEKCFREHDGFYNLEPEYKTAIRFQQQDVRDLLTDSIFNMILCRNLVFTYFNLQLQKTILNNLWQHLEIGGVLIIGVHETLPEENTGFIALSEKLGIFQKVSD